MYDRDIIYAERESELLDIVGKVKQARKWKRIFEPTPMELRLLQELDYLRANKEEAIDKHIALLETNRINKEKIEARALLRRVNK